MFECMCVNYKIWCSLAKVVDLSYTATPCSLIASQNSAILVYTTSNTITTSPSPQLLFSLFFCNKKSVQKEVWKTLNVVRLKPLGRQIYSTICHISVVSSIGYHVKFSKKVFKRQSFHIISYIHLNLTVRVMRHLLYFNHNLILQW